MVMRQKIVLILGIFLFLISLTSVFPAPDLAELCVIAPCIVTKDDGVLSGFLIAPNLDINFINTTIHLGRATHDFDLNFSLREPDGNFLFKDISATKADKNGLWFVEVIGGLSILGDYVVIWDAEHLQNSIPDGNFDAETWQIEIINPVAVATGTGGCEIDLQTNFYLNQYLQITYSGFDVNGNLLTNPSFDLFTGDNLLLDDESLDKIGDSFNFISDKKTNDDPYYLILTANECITTLIVQRNSS